MHREDFEVCALLDNTSKNDVNMWKNLICYCAVFCAHTIAEELQRLDDKMQLVSIKEL